MWKQIRYARGAEYVGIGLALAACVAWVDCSRAEDAPTEPPPTAAAQTLDSDRDHIQERGIARDHRQPQAGSGTSQATSGGPEAFKLEKFRIIKFSVANLDSIAIGRLTSNFSLEYQCRMADNRFCSDGETLRGITVQLTHEFPGQPARIIAVQNQVTLRGLGGQCNQSFGSAVSTNGCLTIDANSFSIVEGTYTVRFLLGNSYTAQPFVTVPATVSFRRGNVLIDHR